MGAASAGRSRRLATCETITSETSATTIPASDVEPEVVRRREHAEPDPGGPERPERLRPPAAARRGRGRRRRSARRRRGGSASRRTGSRARREPRLVVDPVDEAVAWGTSTAARSARARSRRARSCSRAGSCSGSARTARGGAGRPRGATSPITVNSEFQYVQAAAVSRRCDESAIRWAVCSTEVARERAARSR